MGRPRRRRVAVSGRCQGTTGTGRVATRTWRGACRHTNLARAVPPPEPGALPAV